MILNKLDDCKHTKVITSWKAGLTPLIWPAAQPSPKEPDFDYVSEAAINLNNPHIKKRKIPAQFSSNLHLLDFKPDSFQSDLRNREPPNII